MEPIKISPVPGSGTLSTEYGVTAQGEVYAQRGGISGPLTGAGGAFGNPVPLKDIAHISHKGWPVGDVIFKLASGTVALTWENVFQPAAKKRLVEEFKSAAAVLERQRQAQLARKGNVKFSDKVLEMPMISGALYPGVYHRSFGVRDQIPQTGVKVGQWVDQGGFLCSLSMMTSFWGSKKPVITAPVSGRVLVPPVDIFGGTSSVFCAIQLAEGITFPDNIASSYRQFVEVAATHSGYLFRNGGSSLSDQRVQNALANVRAGEFRRNTVRDQYYKAIADSIDARFGGLVVPGDSW